MRALQWLGGLGVLAGVGWTASRLPAAPPDGALALAAGSLLTWVVAHAAGTARRVLASSKGAFDALARDAFAVTRSVLSERRDVLLALDDRARVAICALVRGGAVRVTKIAEPGAVSADAREDDQPLDETTPASRGVRGRLALRVTCGDTDHDLVFVRCVPEDADGAADWEEYEQVRAMVAWWRDTLRGREPAKPYRVAASLLARVSRGEADAAVAARHAELEPEFPGARVVSERPR